jgi:diguanylate cyclase (GGDEF)-like protein/putative nucleotidyltransferase with HDIG domain
MRRVAFITLALGAALLAGSIGLGMRDRSEKRDALDQMLVSAVENEVARLDAYFTHAREINLITAQNPAFREFYADRGERLAKIRARGLKVREAEAGLASVEVLYPNSINEVCFIDRSGGENARYVRGVRAAFVDLSPNEQANPFFKPTFALHAGEVFQARPYVSPDTHEWVISNATPLPGTGFPAAAIVHFEITVESIRQEAAAAAGRTDVSIIDVATGRVVVDSRSPQRIGAPLGRPDVRRFASLVAGADRGGVQTFDGHRAAVRRLIGSKYNANDWYVVASNPHATPSLLTEIGWAPLGMAVAALALLLVAGIGFRGSRRALFEAANCDALTGLSNRRKLMADLAVACVRAAAGDRYALVLYDLDGFKSYNDSFGHLPGDALLRRLGQKLSQTLADMGGVYRLGGDEFCVLVALRGATDADTIAALGAQALSEAGEGFTITASHGTVLLPSDAQAPADALAICDLRMYACKQGGRPSPARQTTDVLVRVQTERSQSLGPHVCEVGDLAVAVADQLGLPEHRVALVRQAAELHDIGKMAIPDAVLEKPGPLTDDEWLLIREHTIIGERMLSVAPALRDIAAIVRASHERYDGAGYPDGTAADDIPVEARIVNAADAYCAMTSDRPYHTARARHEAVGELRRCAGGQFDPTVVDALLTVLNGHPPPASPWPEDAPAAPVSL